MVECEYVHGNENGFAWEWEWACMDGNGFAWMRVYREKRVWGMVRCEYVHGNENGLAWTWMGLHGWEFRERNGYEGWLGVNMCMGMRMGLHGWKRVCMDENLEIEMGMRDGWVEWEWVCMGMRMSLHACEWVCMDESLERETGMRDGWVWICAWN